MFHINENYQKMPGSYLFADIGRKVREFSAANPDKEVIRLGIGDVTLPLAPAVVKEMSQAAKDMGTPEGFKGYPDYEGYEFLRRAIKENDFDPRGVEVGMDEIFVNDGAKSD
ncbi:MAG: LL-diaminopimelate aminotransferase, partial [Verrucomicrobia bacterium]|nr:LL-diaminopimelate aminotransferase [Verrucomicrobiota bacterium]